MKTSSFSSITSKRPNEHDHAAIDLAIQSLNEKKQMWVELSIARKIAYLYAIRERMYAVAQRWVLAATESKGIPSFSPWVGEEWLSGPWGIIHALNGYIATLKAINKTGSPLLRSDAIHTRSNGQVVVDVFPRVRSDGLLLNGIKAEVWMQPEVTLANFPQYMASWYHGPSHTGKVALVLGAGNIASIAPLDVIYKLIAEGQVCLLKMNPVNDYLGPFLEDIFSSLIADGYVQIIYGGSSVGEYVCNHPGIDEIHITGSAATYEAIVFDTGPEGVERKRLNKPLNPRRVTSELGNVSPTIVVPGPWSKADIRFQAEHIVTQKMNNSGFNCISCQVLILPAFWEHTEDLLDEIRKVLRSLPPRDAYYPGAQQRRESFIAEHPGAEIFTSEVNDEVLCVLIPDFDATRDDESGFQIEVFGNILLGTRLAGNSVADYLQNAVLFCNERLRGTLGANIIIHPATERALGPHFEQEIADLKYGCIAINIWTAAGFLLTEMPWGAYPGHTSDNIQSGMGIVHNTYLFDKPQKSVVRGPFYPFPRSVRQGARTLLPKPPWFVTHSQAATVTERLVDFEFHPNLLKLPGILFLALKG
jgi:aldehyde dehydrogenase (NAD(P)+)